MLYPLVRPLAKIALGTYFRRIHLSNLENLPLDKPVILAANHPTAFTEPCILACWLPRPLSFLVRGDFFQNKLANWALRSLNMIPIYRLRDGGFEGLKNNFETLDHSQRALADGRLIMILAEGNSKMEKRLRPLQKGTARLAVGTVQNYPETDLHIVPVGVNYTNPMKFRSDVMIDFGEPIKMSDYAEELKSSPPRVIKNITTLLRERMERSIIIIDREEDEELTEYFFTLRRNETTDRSRPSLVRSDEQLRMEKLIANRVNRLTANEKEDLLLDARNYFQSLDKEGVTDLGLQQPEHASFTKTIFLLLGFIPFVLGYLLNILPAKWVQRIGSKPKKREFKSSVWTGSSVGVFFVFFLLLTILGPIFFGWWGLLLGVATYWLGYFTLIYRENWSRWRQARKAAKLPEKKREELRWQRLQLTQQLEDEYA